MKQNKTVSHHGFHLIKQFLTITWFWLQSLTTSRIMFVLIPYS